ncbi:hypothetical protein ACYSNO_08505 [Enterococcus sp. LJL98]
MKRTKIWAFTCLIACLLIGLFAYQQFEKRRLEQRNDALMKLENNQKAVTSKGEVYQQILACMDDTGYLVSNLSATTLEALQATLDQLRQENQKIIEAYHLKTNWNRSVDDAQDMLTTIQQKWDIQQALNQLFEDPTRLAFNGTTFDSQLPLKATITTIEVERIEKALLEVFVTQESNWKQWVLNGLTLVFEQAHAIETTNRLLAAKAHTQEELQFIHSLIRSIQAPETKAALQAQVAALTESSQPVKIYDKNDQEVPLQRSTRTT